MSARKWLGTAGAVCLLAGPVGQLVQFLVTPIGEADSAATQVSQAADHASRMQWAMSLDLLILLVAPAVLCAGSVAGGARSKLAAAGSGLVFVTWLGAGYLLGSDVLLYVAAQDSDRSAASRLVDGYLSNGVVTGVVVAYIAGHVVGFVLLGIALVRSRAVPRWAGVAVAVWPVLELAGEGSGVRAVAAGGFGLLAVGFGACAVAWLRSRTDATGDAAPGLRIGESAPVTR
jgi:hypothetical protein